MIDQIRHLQARVPFETFALELATGRVIQIHDRHLVATTSGTHHGAGVVGVLHENGTFELIDGSQMVSVSVGIHPKVKKELEARRESVRKRFGGGTEQEK